jgi:metal-sulfur cluster biosynthetic enzyme
MEAVQRSISSYCCDPRVSVEDMGLLRGVEVDEGGCVAIRMSMCCVFGSFRTSQAIREAVMKVQGVREVEVVADFARPWSPVLMSPSAHNKVRLDLEALAEEHNLRPWGATESEG